MGNTGGFQARQKECREANVVGLVLQRVGECGLIFPFLSVRGFLEDICSSWDIGIAG